MIRIALLTFTFYFYLMLLENIEILTEEMRGEPAEAYGRNGSFEENEDTNVNLFMLLKYAGVLLLLLLWSINMFLIFKDLQDLSFELLQAWGLSD